VDWGWWNTQFCPQFLFYPPQLYYGGRRREER
jgi:hypothetical protein